MAMDTGPYALMAELLDSVNVGLCLFDSGDHALLWNRSFLTLFPEHEGHIRVGEHYSVNLRRFYQARLSVDELPLIDDYIDGGIARHRAQTQPFVFQHRGQWLRVASLPTGTEGRIRVWTPLASPTGAAPWNRPGAQADAEDLLLEHVADGVLLLDPDGRIAKANEQALFLYDVPRKSDLIGLSFEELLELVWRGNRSRLPAMLTERQRFPSAPFEVELPGDRWLRVAQQRGVDGIAYTTHVDITEMKRLQTAMIGAREEADRANAAKSRFLAMISHEIRTPMNAIIGIGRIALKSAVEPGQRGYLETINASAGRLLGIINDLLDFSKIEAGKVTIAEQPFSLDEVLEPLCDLIVGNGGADGVEVVIRVVPGTPDRLVGDPLRLGQILANLINNALKFTERGEILVTVGAAPGGADRVTLEVSVADSGIGIDHAQQARLFQPFVQADDTTTRRFGGTGLGLTICKQLVELMGGRIAVSSEPGRGSRFGFAVELGLAAPETPPPPPLGGRVLVVDDHPTARAALVEMVAALGAEPLEAASGPAALLAVEQAAREGRPVTAALVDWRLPGWDGPETIERLRNNGRAAGLPILALMPLDARGDRDRPAFVQDPGGGADGVLVKPVSPGRLRHRLTSLLGGPEERSATPVAERGDLSRLRGARLLLVDDNALNREVALHLLTEARIAVDVAENGVQAVERAGRGDYDLVLMDIQMPVMDGLEATRRIRALPGCLDLPIVAMTAQAMSGDRRTSLAAGLDEHLSKPIEPDLLFDTLLRLIDPVRLAGRRTPRDPAPDAARGGGDAGRTDTNRDMGLAARDAARQAGLDWDGALRRVDGDPAMLSRLVRTFLRDCAGHPQALAEAAATGQTERIRFLAHALRSSSAYIGATDLSLLAGRVEEALRNAHSRTAERLTADLAGELAALLDRLSTLAPMIPSPPDPAIDATLEEAIGRLAELLDRADLRAEDVWRYLQGRLAPAHPDFATAITNLLDDLRYGEALERLRAFARPLGIALPPDTERSAAAIPMQAFGNIL
ncbi:signal transduction histidine kinase/DNA-binding response OmpR family regulator/HPt (histidine-containing phosphotransfer) domain-containing protein [Azospirillum agricola]|uniref:response regulator n=1 Tax=Azospirillum agricola TaxID=1720247 RepID=UPI001AE80009|nr:response regulator [Azospirillum agricola]MBP2228493.1 signal transduction histidine kinase/DNA-binding response OmpR family regulator/HPt (histidine-containing phosphotransfer) domain-containing protein [Azospirillum agricola]